MKIEMNESLVASWLKHVKHCQVVNLNWKASPYWIPVVNDEDINAICGRAVDYFEARQFYILRDPNNQVNGDEPEDANNADWQSMLLATECDAVGISCSGNQMDVYAVESAFHRDGLKYSKKKSWWSGPQLNSNKVTAWNVALKFFKNALSMYRWFGSRTAGIVLVAPMSSEPVERAVIEACSIVRGFFVQEGFNFDFELHFQHLQDGSAESFSEGVLAPVNLAATVVDDTSELYLRGRILSAGVEGIDALMLDLARRLLGAESLDEMAGVYFGTPGDLLAAINELRNMLVVVAQEQDPDTYRRQKSRFDRCHGALRAYYAAYRGLASTPGVADLENEMAAQADRAEEAPEQDIGAHPNEVQVILDPADIAQFKNRLLQTRLARRVRIYADGHQSVDYWRANHFTENSNVMGNIKSSSAFRNALQQGIVRLEYSVVDAVQ